LEDLWAFNEEVVARALCACPVPTVSAVGHEIDVTIADYCADVRAPTPTAAAELIARVKDELVADLAQRKARLGRAMRAQLERKLKALAGRALAARRHRYEGLTARLDALSPLKVLARGYAVAFDERGHALVQANQVRAGERVRVRLHEGELSAQVIEKKNE